MIGLALILKVPWLSVGYGVWPTTLASALRPVDWAVLGVYLALLALAAGVLGRRKSRDSREYFLGTRTVPTWAVVISTLATVQSAATFVGVPGIAYAKNLTYWFFNLAPVIAAIVVARFFVPAYWRAGVATPYELLESRFGAGARRATSVSYLVVQLLGNGARAYIGALPLSLAIFGDSTSASVCWTIAGIMLVSTAITLFGGVRSVIWIDVLQVVVYLGAAVAALFLIWRAIPTPIGEVLSALRETPLADGTGKLTVVDAGWPPSVAREHWMRTETLWTTLTGYTLFNVAVLATNQDFVQRALASRSAGAGSRSIVLASLLNLVTVGLFLAIGLGLYVFYLRADLMGAAGAGGMAGSAGHAAPAASEVFQTFIFTQSPAGLAGLMLAGVLAAGPAGINSTLNSMGATVLNDLYRPLVRGRSERHYLRAGRGAVVASGVMLGLVAMLCVAWQRASELNLVHFSLSVMVLAYAGLLGVFSAAVFTKRGTPASAVAALVVGPLVVIALDSSVYKLILMTPMGGWVSAWLGSGQAAAGERPSLVGIAVAYPWQMCLGFVAAFLACVAVPAKANRGNAVASRAAGDAA